MNTISTVERILTIVEERNETPERVSLSQRALNELLKNGDIILIGTTGTYRGIPLDSFQEVSYNVRVRVIRRRVVYSIHDYDLYYDEDKQKWDSSV